MGAVEVNTDPNRPIQIIIKSETLQELITTPGFSYATAILIGLAITEAILILFLSWRLQDKKVEQLRRAAQRLNERQGD